MLQQAAGPVVPDPCGARADVKDGGRLSDCEAVDGHQLDDGAQPLRQFGYPGEQRPGVGLGRDALHDAVGRVLVQQPRPPSWRTAV